MNLPVYIVTFREIFPEVGAAALFAPKRRLRDEACDRYEIEMLPSLRIGDLSTVHRFVEDRLFHVEGGGRSLQCLARSKQPNGPPHQVANSGAGNSRLGALGSRLRTGRTNGGLGPGSRGSRLGARGLWLGQPPAGTPQPRAPRLPLRHGDRRSCPEHEPFE